MGHLTSRDAYRNLEDRINWFTQGAPASETLTKILEVLFTEKEAKWVAMLPIRPFTLQKYLSELFYQYINVEEDFIKNLFLDMDTKLSRVFVRESVLLSDKANHILDHERAEHIIDEAEYVGVGTCFCRHKNYHLGIPCKIGAPMETCLTFDNVARSLAEHGGYTRLISKEEAKDILQMCFSYDLVQMGENVREHPAFMCNCCGCCCEALEAARKFGPMQPIATTNYIPKITEETCIGCGKCERTCPVNAISMTEACTPSAEEAGQPSAAPESRAPRKEKRPLIDESICLGCGLCAKNCPTKAIVMERRPIQVITPVNSTHRFVAQAIEKGTLQNLVFDNQAFANHRAMAAVFGVILKLPPIKQALASRQFKSVYLDRLLSAQKEK